MKKKKFVSYVVFCKLLYWLVLVIAGVLQVFEALDLFIDWTKNSNRFKRKFIRQWDRVNVSTETYH